MDLKRFFFTVAACLAAASASANQLNSQVTALPEIDRQVIFARLMRGGGERCET